MIRSIKADSEQDSYEAKNAIDGDPDTIWHTSMAEFSLLQDGTLP